MTFELLPTIDTMLDLYEQPRSMERFQEYLKILQGNTKGSLAMPIGGFNPMAKEHLVGKLNELKQLGAEQIIEKIVQTLNSKYHSENPKRHIRIALNLSDDLKGGWTNCYTSDYDSKFSINGLVSRDFCTPIFWTSEDFTEAQIRKRVLEYIFRTVYWLSYPKPKTFKEHIEQEVFVVKNTALENVVQEKNRKSFSESDHFYQNNKDSDNYHLIFNFLYGDKASISLGFPTFGNEYGVFLILNYPTI